MIDARDTLSLSITQLARLYRAKEVSPVDVTRACLDRIASIDGRLNAFITVTADMALQQAEQAAGELAHGTDRGPLHGVPIALKDLYATAGIRTTAHSKVLQDWVPTENAATTHALYDAGAVLLGKLAMHEFAYGTPNFDTPWPPARNPWDPARVTGGSSSGSGTALAALMCFGSLGSDTGGSIRNPAHLCGIAGHKPTYGLVSRRGVVPLAWSLDHAGPMARTVEDCAVLLQAIAGHDPADAGSADRPVPDFRAGIDNSLRGLRAGIPRSWLHEGDGATPEVLAAFEAAVQVLRDLGVEVVDVDGEPFSAARWPNTTILLAEAYTYHEQTLKERPQDLAPGLRNRLREGAFLSAADYLQAQRARTQFIAKVRDIMRGVDVVLSPAGPATAATFEELASDPEAAYRVPSFTNAYNLTGLPALSVPCGFDSRGLPIGLQIAGRAFEDALVLRVGHAYEQATDWHKSHPEVQA